MKNKQTEQQITALYERLSRDDDQIGESNSIKNQKILLQTYADQHGFSNCQHYTDDGISGATFTRPSWERMIADIEVGKVSTVIVKDMSRVGRNYLQTGYYTEVYFPQNHVRFIAISNGIDSNDNASGEIAPFLNIMNEWYVRDTSRKIRQAIKIRADAGLPLTNNVPYGYKKSPDDKYKWIVDEEAAAVVKRIFCMAMQGIGVGVIARTLQKEKVERPSYYMHTRGYNRYATDLSRPYDWADKTVSDILARPDYTGNTVNRKTYTVSYKDKTKHKNNASDWQVIENTHEAIIDKETFDAVQKIRQTRRRIDTIDKVNVLTGLVFCADCGSKMYNHRGHRVRGKVGKDGRPDIDSYECSTYKLTRKHEDVHCFSHYISNFALRSLLLDVIRETATHAITDPDAFMQRILQESQIKRAEEAKELRRKAAKAKKRIAELDTLMQRSFEEYALGRLPQDRYDAMVGGYEREKAELKVLLAEDERVLDSFAEDSERAKRFVVLARKYTDFTELTDEMILEFVDKIIVHAADKSSGVRQQEVEIFLKYIGKVEIPESPQEEAVDPKILASKEKRRKYAQEYYFTVTKPKQQAARAAARAEKAARKSAEVSAICGA